MRLKNDTTPQKLRGAYYTPLNLAEAIVGFFAAQNVSTVLEPSCGDGVFLTALENYGMLSKLNHLTAVEIAEEEAKKVRAKFADYDNVKVYTADFLAYFTQLENKARFDLILGNPPYIRYQYLRDSQRELLAEILSAHGLRPNKLINAWVAFVVACVQMLSENGKIAFIIPAEILQVAYAEELRLYLANNLAKITLITFDRLVFPDIEQEVLIFIGEKGQDEKGIRIIEVSDLNDLTKLQLEQNNFQKMLHVREKWTKYFVNNKENALIRQIRRDPRFAKFSEYALINVGITTGNNNYFSVTEETTRQYNLEGATLPLIARSSHTHGIYFSAEDWELNKMSGKRARLIVFPEIPYKDYPSEYKAYIEMGEKYNEHIGYKCSIRDRWYIVPSVWAPDAFFMRRSGLYPKFVLNRCAAVSTDTMHRVKFFDKVKPENILLSYYNSISFAFAELCGRSYGGGVLEILPGEMGKILLPKTENITPRFRDNILDKVDRIVRNNEDIEKALDIVDQELLVNQLKIDVNVCSAFRQIWKKMQRRRLRRGSIPSME